MSTSIHQEVFLNASPQEVYQSFMDDARHSAFTQMASTISTEPGGMVSMHDGQIVGRNIELEKDRKIVQAWRVAGWEDGVYTLLKIVLSAHDGGTKIVLDQTGCPEGMSEHLASGWHQRYWEPLKAHFDK
ncbi:MAG: SRPBCC domain-containing protein [Rhizobiales bacterium]|nr:SRPBCC domain-containing protein [Hyphomicrobiales bacterium]